MNLQIFKSTDSYKQIFSISLFFSVIFAALIFFLLIPNIKKITQTRDNIIGQKIQMERDMINQRNISTLSKKIEEIEPQLNKLEQIFINKNRELEFITALEGIAQNNNISQNLQLNPASEDADKLYKKIPLTLKCQGEFKHIINYLTDLEALQYYVTINYLAFSSQKSSKSAQASGNNTAANNPIVTMQIKADTYWQS